MLNYKWNPKWSSLNILTAIIFLVALGLAVEITVNPCLSDITSYIACREPLEDLQDFLDRVCNYF